MDIILVLAVMGFFLSVGFFITGLVEKDRDACVTSVPVSIILFLVIIIIACSESEEPKAIDVYQDKTTLEITYKDSVPVDSVVVFK